MEIVKRRAAGAEMSGAFDSISSAAGSLLGSFDGLGNAFGSIERKAGSLFQRLDDGSGSLDQYAARVDADFNALEQWGGQDFGFGDDPGGGSGSYGRGGGGFKGSGRGRSRSSSDIAGSYAQAMSNLALANALHPDVAYSAGFVDSLRAQYQAQVNAYQEAMGINTIKGGGPGGGGASGGGINITINGVTIKGASNIDGVDGLATQLENAIAQNIQRNTSPITAALKQAGV